MGRWVGFIINTPSITDIVSRPLDASLNRHGGEQLFRLAVSRGNINQ